MTGQVDLFGVGEVEPAPTVVDVSAGTLATHTRVVPGAVEVDLGGAIRVLRLSADDARDWADVLAAKADELGTLVIVPCDCGECAECDERVHKAWRDREHGESLDCDCGYCSICEERAEMEHRDRDPDDDDAHPDDEAISRGGMEGYRDSSI